MIEVYLNHADSPFFPPTFHIVESRITNSRGFAICHGGNQRQGQFELQSRNGDGISESENKRRGISSRPSNRTIDINLLSLLIVVGIFVYDFNIQPRLFLR